MLFIIGRQTASWKKSTHTHLLFHPNLKRMRDCERKALPTSYFLWNTRIQQRARILTKRFRVRSVQLRQVWLGILFPSFICSCTADKVGRVFSARFSFRRCRLRCCRRANLMEFFAPRLCNCFASVFQCDRTQSDQCASF